MDLKDIMLSEISQTEKVNTISSHLYVKSRKQNKQKERKQTHKYIEQMGGHQRGVGVGQEGGISEGD